MIWSREEFGTEYGYRPVVATKSTPNIPIYEVQILHDSGLTETFNTTEEHPFYIEGEGWRKASILEAGMKLLDKDGKPTATIISQSKLEETDTVYNFEVQDFRTYHIGEVGVWVHNADCCDFLTGKDGTVVDIRNMSPQEIVGVQRELKVTNMTGGTPAKTVKSNGVVEDKWIYDQNGNRVTGIDVFGKNGEYIAVGGPAKGSTPAKLDSTLSKLEALKSEAEKNGTKAMAYYERGNSDKFRRLIEESKRILGEDNVIIFDK